MRQSDDNSERTPRRSRSATPAPPMGRAARWSKQTLRWVARGHAAVTRWSSSDADDEPDEFHSSESIATLGPMLEPADAPGVFELLAEVAFRIDSIRPSDVRVSTLPACGVLERPTRDPLDDGQTLVIGMPCFLVWTRGELGAVLTHELAHLRLEDAGFTREVVEYFDRAADAHEKNGGSSRSLLAKCAHWSAWVCRQMERRADRWAADCWGAAPIVRALEKLAVADAIFRQAIATFDPLKDPDGNVYAYFASAWNRMTDEQFVRLRDAAIERSTRAPRDKHPSLRERLDWLRTTSASSPRKRPSSVALLGNAVELQSALHNHLYRERAEGRSAFHRFFD